MSVQFLARIRTQLRSYPSVTTSTNTTTGAPLSPSAIQRGLRLSIIEGALANILINVTMGAFLTGFGLLLGAGDFELGLLGAMPFVSQLFQFAGAYLEVLLGERHRLTVVTSLVGRLLWLPIALLPFVTSLAKYQLLIFLLVMAISQAFLGITSNAWMSWMSDLVPPRQRGRYFGTRNTIMSISAMLGTWIAGYAIDHYRRVGDERMGYLLVFGVAVACGVASSIVLNQQPEPPLVRQRMSIRALFGAPLRHRRFRTFCLIATGWAFVNGIAAPFFNAYGIQTLKIPFATLALFTVATSAVSLVTQPLIGRLQDRYGDRTVLIGSVLGVILLPWGWILSTPTFLLPVWLTSIFAGFFWPGIIQGLVNLLMDRAPAEGRGAYVAAYGAITGAGTFVSSLVGGALAIGLSATAVHFGPILFDHYVVLFILSSIGRWAMTFIFARYL